MRTAILTFLSCCITGCMVAQDWNPLHPNWVYYYQTVDPTGVFSDSLNPYPLRILESDGDTFFLNKILRFEVGPQKRDLVNQPLFLQKKVVQLSDGGLVFEDTTSFYIAPVESQMPWIFDASRGITADVEALIATTTYGQPDSVRILILSTGDSILQSKSFGYLKFPDLYGPQDYYVQVGIAGPDLGRRPPTYQELVLFDIGDVLEYHTMDWTGYKDIFPGGYYRYDTTISQYEIIDTMHTALGINYQVIKNEWKFGLHVNRDNDNYEDSTILLGPNIENQIIWTDFKENPFTGWGFGEIDPPVVIEAYPWEEVRAMSEEEFGDTTFQVGTVSYRLAEFCGERVEKWLNMESYIADEYSGDVIYLAPPYHWSGKAKWQEGLGIVSLYMDNSGTSSLVQFPTKFSRMIQLVSFNKGGVQCGDWPTDLEEELLNLPLLTPYPVPAREVIMIPAEPNGKPIKASLYQMNGQFVETYQIVSSNNPYGIDVSNLVSGTYLLSLSSPQSSQLVQWHKIIILP